MNIVVQRNVAALITQRAASAPGSAVAAGSGDATTVTGISINREGLGNGSLPDSALFAVNFGATLASGKTLSLALTVQDSADNSSWSDYQTQASAVVATGPSGGGVVNGQANLGVNLTSARQWIRLNWQPDLSATGTDTSVGIGVAVLAGFDRLAAPA